MNEWARWRMGGRGGRGDGWAGRRVGGRGGRADVVGGVTRGVDWWAARWVEARWAPLKFQIEC